jgi:hypothetical protein
VAIRICFIVPPLACLERRVKPTGGVAIGGFSF